MKKIQLGHHQQGRKYKNPIMWALIDNRDFKELSKYKWSVRKDGKKFYVVRSSKTIDGYKTLIHMHVQIMKTPKGMDTDHIDGNGLNNQQSNLRICTRSENQMNQHKKPMNTSGYKGVSWHKPSKKWYSRIMVNGKAIHLGFFKSKQLAYMAYIKACKYYHKEFANF